MDALDPPADGKGPILAMCSSNPGVYILFPTQNTYCLAHQLVKERRVKLLDFLLAVVFVAAFRPTSSRESCFLGI